jgi:hypothetical protein
MDRLEMETLMITLLPIHVRTVLQASTLIPLSLVPVRSVVQVTSVNQEPSSLTPIT